MRPVVVVAAVVWLLWAGSAQALPRFRHLDQANSPAMSDGVRYAAFERTVDVVRVLDAQSRSSFDLAAPTGVSYDGRVTPCGLLAVGGGAVLWECSGTTRWMIEGIADRRVMVPPGLDALPPHVSTRFDGIGTYWLRGEMTTGDVHSHPLPVYLNWHTGEVRTPPGFNHYGDHHTEDLNWPALERPICAPIKRPSFRFEDAYLEGMLVLTRAPFYYEPPYGVTARGFDRPLVLGRCGQRKLSPIPDEDFWTEVEIGAGVVTWAGQRQIHAYLPATKTSYAWDLGTSGIPDTSSPPGVVHTRKSVFISSFRSPTPGTRFDGAWTIKVAQLAKPTPPPRKH